MTDLIPFCIALIETSIAVARGAVTGFSLVWAFFLIGPRLSKKWRRPFNDIRPTRTGLSHMWALARRAEPALRELLHRSIRMAVVMAVFAVLIYSHWLLGMHEVKPGFWPNIWHYLALTLAPCSVLGGAHEVWTTLKQVAGIAGQEIGDEQRAALHAEEDAADLEKATIETAGERAATRRL